MRYAIRHASSRSNPAFPRTRKLHKFDGVGGYAPNSTRIPPIDAVLFVGGTAVTIWATLGLARWIWG